MKKITLHVLRIAIAAAGVGYILFSLTWRDQVVFAPGATLDTPQGVVSFDTETPLVVMGRSPDGGVLIVQAPGPDGQPVAAEVAVSRLATQRGPDVSAAHLRPGIATMLREARGQWLWLGLAMVGPVYLLQSLRWWTLMRARRLEIGYWQTFRLYMVGCFFNYCMPGTTGGDVAKVYYAARREDKRADAVVSVAADRMVGMLGLLLFASLCGLLMLDDPLARQVAVWLWLGLLAVVVAAGLYVAPPVRRVVGAMIAGVSMPGRGLLAAVDTALLAYRRHGRAVAAAVGLSMVAHLLLAGGTAVAGMALGLDAPLGRLLTVLPVLFMAGSVPLTYQGLGVMEGLGVALLLSPPHITANQIIGMLLMIRLYQITFSLIGALFLIRGNVQFTRAVTAEGTGRR
jgi:glycosyltransferase 2 family protein